VKSKPVLDALGKKGRYYRIPDALVFFSFLGLWSGWLV
jgi:hypothetical protein